MGIRIIRDMGECEQIWKRVYPIEGLFDLWDVRACFARSYKREPYFIVDEDNSVIRGLIPLCFIEETESYAFFPGETWHHKTWIEQNKIVAVDDDCLSAMLEAVPSKSHIRYLKGLSGSMADRGLDVDEIGYLFYPESCGYSFDQYLLSIPGKSRKKIIGETEKIKAKGISFRVNDIKDIDWVFNLNLQSFGDQSYFYDERFKKGFDNLIEWLKDHDMLRIVTLLVGNEIAAVDIGAVFEKQCILLAGGTHRGYPGVAKVINLFHIKWACNERMAALDFLCGDFGWKERFRLSPRPLYLFNDTLKPGLNPMVVGERIHEYAA